MKKLCLLFLLPLALVCPAQEVRRALPVGTGLPEDAMAKLLAGRPVPSSSPLLALQQTPAGLQHAAAMAKLWTRYETNFFAPMRTWSAASLAPRISPALPLLYFFGGPDAISAFALYPDATDYILGGLEPVGGVPETISPATLDADLAAVRGAVDVVLSYGHFITKEMKTELAAGNFQGVLPVLLAFVALSGGEVTGIVHFGILPDGSLQNYGTTFAGPRGVLPGVRITFRPSGSLIERRLIYVQANVADDPLKANPAVLTWAASFGAANVYLKAASYLMHEPYFSRIRSFLLAQGRSVLQDDSGIPLSFFRDGSWRLWFFGTYSGTLDIFKKYAQPEAATAFAAASEPLPFGTGYKWRRGESNLLLAVRQEAPPRAEPLSPAATAPAETPDR